MARLRTRYALVAFFGIVVGCVATTVSPVLRTWAHPTGGTWRCYAFDRFEDGPEAAAAWGPAQQATLGLNQVARHTPPGTIVTFTYEVTALTCVKY